VTKAIDHSRDRRCDSKPAIPSMESAGFFVDTPNATSDRNSHQRNESRKFWKFSIFNFRFFVFDGSQAMPEYR
jgi:hypothetical protein